MSIFSENFNPYEEFVLNEDYFNISLGLYAPKGTAGYRTEIGFIDNNSYEFKAFEVYKMYLDVTRNAQTQAEELLPTITARQVKSGLFSIHHNLMIPRKFNDRVFLLEEKTKGNLWRFFSYQILCLIFAYTTLEAFANKLIWQKDIQLNEISKLKVLTKQHGSKDKFTLEQLKKLISNQNKLLSDRELLQDIKNLLLNDDQSQIVLIKSDFLKQLNLDEKLFEVILKVYNIENHIKDLQTTRDQVTKIVKLRNVFVHLKDRDLRTGAKPSITGRKIWGELIPKFNKTHNELRFKPYNIVDALIKQIQAAINPT